MRIYSQSSSPNYANKFAPTIIKPQRQYPLGAADGKPRIPPTVGINNDVITYGKVLFEIAEPPLFCHPVRDRLTLNKLDNFEAKGFLQNDKIQGKGIKLGDWFFEVMQR